MMTQETDYLQIDIQKYIPLQSYRSSAGDNSRYVTGNNFTNRAGEDYHKIYQINHSSMMEQFYYQFPQILKMSTQSNMTQILLMV